MRSIEYQVFGSKQTVRQANLAIFIISGLAVSRMFEDFPPGLPDLSEMGFLKIIFEFQNVSNDLCLVV